MNIVTNEIKTNKFRIYPIKAPDGSGHVMIHLSPDIKQPDIIQVGLKTYLPEGTSCSLLYSDKGNVIKLEVEIDLHELYDALVMVFDKYSYNTYKLENDENASSKITSVSELLTELNGSGNYQISLTEILEKGELLFESVTDYLSYYMPRVLKLSALPNVDSSKIPEDMLIYRDQCVKYLLTDGIIEAPHGDTFNKHFGILWSEVSRDKVGFSQYYLRHISSKDDLSKALDEYIRSYLSQVNVDFKQPQALFELMVRFGTIVYSGD